MYVPVTAYVKKSVYIKGELTVEEDLTVEGHVEGRIELKDASDFRPGQRGAWMRLRFAVSGEAAKAGSKEPPPEEKGQGGETKAPESETIAPASATNSEPTSTTPDETNIKAATGN